MKLSELPALGEVIDRQREDPEFREEWDRSAFAREVAIRIIRYRADRGLTQTQLAQAVGMLQPVTLGWSVVSSRRRCRLWPGSPQGPAPSSTSM
jgi:hypothetical protein